MPLALHGVIIKKNGEKVPVNIGEDENDPVFCISDLLIHLAQEQMAKNAKDVVEGEALNLIVGGRPLAGEEKDAVRPTSSNCLMTNTAWRRKTSSPRSWKSFRQARRATWVLTAA